jgi:hypothetical protein
VLDVKNVLNLVFSNQIKMCLYPDSCGFESYQVNSAGKMLVV